MAPTERQALFAGLLGLAVGDALGWPLENRGNRVGGTAKLEPRWELMSWIRREGGGYAPHQEEVDQGSISDDTQLALAVCRSVLRGPQWWEHLTRVELPVWTTYERGGGGASKRAAKSWFAGREPWSSEHKPEALESYYNAGGNGTAMRCLPYAAVAEDWPQLRSMLDRDAIATHGHPRAIMGSRVFGWAAWWCLHRPDSIRYGELINAALEAVGEWSAWPPDVPESWIRNHPDRADFNELWATTAEEVLDALWDARTAIAEGAAASDRETLDRLGAFGKQGGAGTTTAVIAIFLATRYITQPRQGTLTAAYAKGADTDTVAAMSAGLLGLLAGDDWLRGMDRTIQDGRYIRELATQVSMREHRPVGRPFGRVERTDLYAWLNASDAESTYYLEPFGRLRIARITSYESSQAVRAWTLRSDIGQTIRIKRYGGRGKPPWQSPWVAQASRQTAATLPTSPAPPADEALYFRHGVVVRVADLERAADFYEGVLRMRPLRRAGRYLTFGWLAIEEAVTELTSPYATTHSPSVRVYTTPTGLNLAVDELRIRGIDSFEAMIDDRPALVTTDPDGNRVEFVVDDRGARSAGQDNQP